MEKEIGSQSRQTRDPWLSYEEKEAKIISEQEKKSKIISEQEKKSETVVTFRNKEPEVNHHPFKDIFDVLKSRYFGSLYDEEEDAKAKIIYEHEKIQYRNDMIRSDGFDVGVYRKLIPQPGLVSCYYNPLINRTLSRSDLDTLLCLSNLAISLYNMHQSPPTCYDSVKVLKAMSSSGCNLYRNYNLTFQASLPGQLPITFQTKVCANEVSRFFEIVFVRKVKADDDHHHHVQEIDFMGVERKLSREIRFTPEEQKLDILPRFDDDDEEEDEEDNHIYSPYTDSGFKLPLPLSQLALHMFHEKTSSSYDLRYGLHTVNVLDTKKSLLAAQEGATYLITFEAFWRGNPEIFQTKIHLSPLVPPVSIKIKSVKIVPPF